VTELSVERIELRQVSQQFVSTGGSLTTALAGVDLTIDAGEFVTIVGPSGCGKTTLLRLIAGFQSPTDGEVLVNGAAIGGPGPDRGFVFQQPTLFPWLTVRGNVELGPRLQGASPWARRAHAEELLELVGLAGSADLRPYELSGGMQQRCAIARALATDPAVVLMDEPFGALDAITREHLQDELLRIWQRTSKTIVFVTHSVEEAVYLGTRVLVLSPAPGMITLDAPVELRTRERGDIRLLPEFTALRAEVGSHIGRTPSPAAAA
jgi:ABC-type nitrate/sulfonate/bicarbonate transport system ATPase subunit